MSASSGSGSGSGSAGRPLRILHVCPRPSFSGLEAYALSMAAGQKALGHSVDMIVLAGSPLAERCKNEGIAIIEISDGIGARAAFVARQAQRLSGASKESAPPDIVHLHSTQDIDLMLAPLLLSRARGSARPRVVLQTHIWISHSKRDPLHAIAYSLVDEVWCSSIPAKRTLERFLPIAKEKIRILNYGRDIETISAGFLPREEARAKFGIAKDAIVVGNVARIDRGKGTHELLEAMLGAMTREPKLELLWIGPPTADDPAAIEYARAIEARVEELEPGTRARLHFPGTVPDSYRYLKALDLFALPTYCECFSLSLLEAQLASLPAIGANAGGTPELVREGTTGWLFAPESVDAAAEALERALSARSSWSSLGSTASARVKAEFDFSRILPTTIESYRRLLS